MLQPQTSFEDFWSVTHSQQQFKSGFAQKMDEAKIRAADAKEWGWGTEGKVLRACFRM